MLSEVITGYNSLKNKVINKLSNCEEGINGELDFLDDSLIIAKIEYLKKIAKLVDSEMLQRDDEKKALLIQQKQDIMFELVFLASNNIGNIDFSLSILEEENEFRQCLRALKYWSNGEDRQAISILNDYFETNIHALEHYLISRVYGELLYDSQRYERAAIFLRKAVEKRPEEIELHLKLKDIYMKIGEDFLLGVEEEILSILE